MVLTITGLLIACALSASPIRGETARPKPETATPTVSPAEAAETKLELHRAQEQKAQHLFELGVISRRQLDQAKAALQSAIAEFERLHQGAGGTPASPVDPAAPAAPQALGAPPDPAATPADELTALARLKALQEDLAETESHLHRQEKLADKALTELRADLAEAGAGGELHGLAASARQYVGAQYRWGGTTSRGFDCSGLVYRLLQLQRVSAPRTAEGLFRIGQPVKKENLRSGDLVFFKDTYKPGISHVGIYLAEGEFIHASGVAKGVTVSKLSEPLYTDHYAGARRLVP